MDIVGELRRHNTSPALWKLNSGIVVTPNISSHRPNGGVNHGALAIGKKMIEVGANLYSDLETGGNYRPGINSA
ncbi:MAG: hypothetical protein Q8O18_12755, partial [Deltaproteobacteria bacterium]|nr:hypothetical protein [Deltaproteobacteria bacterium]